MGTLYLSHRFDLLAKALSENIVSDGRSPLASRIIWVPHGAMKQWLLVQLSLHSAQKGVAGYKIFTLKEALSELLPRELLPSTSVELFLAIYHELAKTQNQDLLIYLTQNEKRLVELSDHMAALFADYGEYGLNLESQTSDWQTDLFRSLFLDGNLKLPIQTLSQNVPLFQQPIHCFGFDFLPPLFWQLLHQSFSTSIYLFSPCSQYWDDLCSDRERRGWGQYWKKKGMDEHFRKEWDDYWLQAPSLLANWGKMGRETIKILDSFDLEIKDDYSPVENQKDSLLKKIQSDLLDFSEKSTTSFLEDHSLQIFLSGSSRLREIENLRESVLKWVQEEGLLPSEISVFAPEIDPYVPLIEYVFADIPYRIFGASIGSKSFFFQGLHRLLDLIEGDWQKEDLSILFETPSFLKKQGWDGEKIEQFRNWLSEISIDQAGIEKLLSRMIYLIPQEKRTIEISSSDTLETFLFSLVSLREDLLPLKTKKISLGSWADTLQKLADKYLVYNLLDEADMAAFSFFERLLQDLRRMGKKDLSAMVPFLPIQHLLKQNLQGQIHASHLHAIRFSSLKLGSIIPNKAIFLLGMDEESFPRFKLASSLNLLKKEKIYVLNSADEDRYLFLQLLFAARDFFYMSYCHLSPDEGKPIGPSILVEELLRSAGGSIAKKTLLPSPKISCEANYLLWPERYKDALPEGDLIISLADLASLARHPWKFYLQKKLGIYFEEEAQESFLLSKAKLFREGLKTPIENVFKREEELLPLGICGEVIREEVREKINERDEILESWGISIASLFSVVLKESCEEKRWIDEKKLEVPSLRIPITEHLQVRIIGEIKGVSPQGAIHFGEDNLAGVLKNWPEYLAASIVQPGSQLFLLKSGKIKAVEDPERHLREFIAYYFHALSAPSPLLNLWADPLLSKGVEEVEKKIRNSSSGKGIRFEDPVFDWVIDRIQPISAEETVQNWAPLLKKVFSGLMDLYPSRGKNHAKI